VKQRSNLHNYSKNEDCFAVLAMTQQIFRSCLKLLKLTDLVCHVPQGYPVLILNFRILAGVYPLGTGMTSWDILL